MKRRFLKTLITVFVMSSLIVTPVLADPGEGGQTGDVQALEIQKSEVESQASDVQSQLVALLVQFDALQQDMANQEVRIAQAETDLQSAQETERQQFEDMKKRIKYIYEEGDASFLETIVTAKNFSDLVNKAEYVQNVHEYDRKQLKEYVDTREKVENLKVELEGGKADMEVMSAGLAEQQIGLESTLNTMRSQIADFDSQLETAKMTAAAELNQLTKETESLGTAADTGNASNVGGGQGTGGGSNQPAKPSGGGNAGGGSTGGGNAGSGSGGGSQTSTPGNAALGQQIANRGCQYVGNPYVYGGTSLTNGIDCSAFVQAIHAQFGISTPRDSWSQLAAGKSVNVSDMLPGDVIVYSNHVAIYIGGNQIVHASNSQPYPAGGIKISSPANYKTILGVRRYW